MSMKLLVVDDDRNIARMIAEHLSALDVTCLQAFDGVKALDTIRKQFPEIIITDVKMPNMDGFELFENVKSIWGYHPVIIFMTGYGNIPDATKSIKCGVFEYIEKPFSMNKLMLTVSSAMDHYSLIQENRYLRKKLQSISENSHEASKAGLDFLTREKINGFNKSIRGETSLKELFRMLIACAMDITSSLGGSILLYTERDNFISLNLTLSVMNSADINNNSKQSEPGTRLQSMDYMTHGNENELVSLSQSLFGGIKFHIEDANHKWGVLYLHSKIGANYDINDKSNVAMLVDKLVERLNEIKYKEDRDVFNEESSQLKKEYRRLIDQSKYYDQISSIYVFFANSKLKIIHSISGNWNSIQYSLVENNKSLMEIPCIHNIEEDTKKKIQEAVAQRKFFVNNFVLSTSNKNEAQVLRIKIIPLTFPINSEPDHVSVVILENITEQDRLENRLKALENLSIVGRMIATVAHDLNNPLDGLNRLAKIIEGKVGDRVDQEIFQMIYSTIKRMSSTINRFLEDTKSAITENRYISVNQLLDESIFIMGNLFSEKNIKIETKYDIDTKKIRLSTDFYNVFINIIKNAHDSMGFDGVLTIDACVEDKGEALKISFVDKGRGFSSEVLKNLGKPFFTTKEDGTGLGLAICERIVKYYNGCIQFENAPHGGAQVIIRLPVSKRASASFVEGKWS